MATYVRPPQSADLKKVLKLHKQISNINLLIGQNEETLKTLQSAGISNSYHYRELKKEVSVLKKQVLRLQEELKNLPALCDWCKGEQLIITGYQTDSICPGCHGDGLQNGPAQKQLRRQISKIVGKIKKN